MKCKAKQIRIYTLHPFGRVVDHRTGLETSDVRSVLDGKLDGFMEAALYAGIGSHPGAYKNNIRAREVSSG